MAGEMQIGKILLDCSYTILKELAFHAGLVMAQEREEYTYCEASAFA